jgi:hypothetical protein
MQQTLTSITEQSILKLEQKGYRFRVSRHTNGREVLLINPGELGCEKWLKQVKVKEAIEYLSERAQGYIAECRRLINAKPDN